MTPDKDLRTALYDTVSPVFAEPIARYLSGKLLSLSVSQFAKIYTALKQAGSQKDRECLAVVAWLFALVKLPINLDSKVTGPFRVHDILHYLEQGWQELILRDGIVLVLAIF